MTKLTKKQMVFNALDALGPHTANPKLKEWLKKKYPSEYFADGTLSGVKSLYRKQMPNRPQTTPTVNGAGVSESGKTPDNKRPMTTVIYTVALTADVLQLAQKYNLDAIEEVVRVLQGKERADNA